MRETPIQQAAAKFGFKKSPKTLGRSVKLNCSFWETDYEDVLITDYNVVTHEDLKLRDIVMLWIPTQKYMKVSNLYLQGRTKEEMDLIIEEFLRICEK